MTAIDKIVDKINHEYEKMRESWWDMTADELTEVSFDCRRRFNSARSIFTRAFEPSTNMRTPYRFMTYLLYNPLFRKEVFKKQGLRFGLEETRNEEI